MKYGAILKACRERAGMSQEEIAELIHRSRSCISKFENDQKTLDVHTLIQWVNVTSAKDVMVAFLCGMDGITIMQSIISVIGG